MAIVVTVVVVVLAILAAEWLLCGCGGQRGHARYRRLGMSGTPVRGDDHGLVDKGWVSAAGGQGGRCVILHWVMCGD